MANSVNAKNARKGSLMSSGFKYIGRLPLKPIAAVKDLKHRKCTSNEAALFLVKILVLEGVRRFSRDRCPYLWTGVQALQVFCYPPLKWIQRWNPFGSVIKGMQMLSRPLLVLSVVNAISDHPGCSGSGLGGADDSQAETDSQMSSESHSELQPLQSDYVMGASNENHQNELPTIWMDHLSKELDNLGITLPERMGNDELERFYIAANGDLRSFVSSVKKTICWRGTYRILSAEELEMWSNMIFWHGLDVKGRPCLIVLLGMACTSLRSQDKPRFVQALVSQVEHGVLHLLDGENCQFTVLVDCLGLSPLRFPMQMMRYCCNLLQDHFPNVLGCLIVIRLPPVVRVIAQTFIQETQRGLDIIFRIFTALLQGVLKPVTKKKLRIEGETYKRALHECFQTLPSYLGGQCNCTRCSEFEMSPMSIISDNTRVSSTIESDTESTDSDGLQEEQPIVQYDGMTMDGSFSGTIRSAIIGVLIMWVLIALIEGLYNLESD